MCSRQLHAGNDAYEGFPLVRRANISRAARPQWNPKRPFSEQKTFPKNGRITLEAAVARALLARTKILRLTVRFRGSRKGEIDPLLTVATSETGHSKYVGFRQAITESCRNEVNSNSVCDTPLPQDRHPMFLDDLCKTAERRM